MLSHQDKPLTNEFITSTDPDLSKYREARNAIDDMSVLARDHVTTLVDTVLSDYLPPTLYGRHSEDFLRHLEARWSEKDLLDFFPGGYPTIDETMVLHFFSHFVRSNTTNIVGLYLALLPDYPELAAERADQYYNTNGNNKTEVPQFINWWVDFRLDLKERRAGFWYDFKEVLVGITGPMSDKAAMAFFIRFAAQEVHNE